MKAQLFFLSCFVSIAVTSFADVQPSTMFGNGMVLQRDMPVPVWGKADPGESVFVEFAGQKKTVAAGADGKWMVKLDPLRSSNKGGTLTISGKNSHAYTDVLVGEVWICSGQSNMQMGYNAVAELKKLVPMAEKLPIRHFAVTTFVSFQPLDNPRGNWSSKPASSAVAFGLSYYLQKHLNVPVAVIQTCWGSSSIEGWMPLDMTKQLPHFAAAMKTFGEKDRAKVTKLLNDAKTDPKGAPRCWARNDNIYLRTRPNILYNAMLHPVAPYATRGLVWYQGESNAGKPDEYAQSLPAWVTRVRQQWGQERFQFMAVMLPGFGRLFGGENKSVEYPDNFSWAWFREAQMEVLKLSGTSVANTIDLGAEKDIHPKDKTPIGRRLALLAASDVNGQNVPARGPMYKQMSTEGAMMTVTFDHADGMKTTDGKPPRQFWIAGKDQQWKPAEASINGSEVTLKAIGIDAPVAVRYAFAGFPKVNLVNSAGLPAYPFRTDNWERK